MDRGSLRVAAALSRMRERERLRSRAGGRSDSSDATVAAQAPDRCLTCLDGEARGPQEGGASLLMHLADEARTRATGTSSTARSTAREVTPGRRFRALR